jgi:hypothetical protein
MIFACVVGFCVNVSGFYAVEVRDLDFMMAQEAFAVQARPLRRPPEQVRAIFDQIAGGTYRERQRASQKLLHIDPRWLYYGVVHQDAEIQWRCDAVLRFRAACQECRSTGRCVGLFPPDTRDYFDQWSACCLKCGEKPHRHRSDYSGAAKAKCSACNGRMAKLFQPDEEQE